MDAVAWLRAAVAERRSPPLTSPAGQDCWARPLGRVHTPAERVPPLAAANTFGRSAHYLRRSLAIRWEGPSACESCDPGGAI